MIKPENPLTPKQKKAAQLLALGLKRKEITKKLKITRETLWRWRQLPRFQKKYTKYINKFDLHIEKFLEAKQKHMLEIGLESLYGLLKSGNAKSIAIGLELLFKINNKLQNNGILKHQHEHEGALDLRTSGEIKIKKKKLKKKERRDVMDLLDKTRHLISNN